MERNSTVLLEFNNDDEVEYIGQVGTEMVRRDIKRIVGDAWQVVVTGPHSDVAFCWPGWRFTGPRDELFAIVTRYVALVNGGTLDGVESIEPSQYFDAIEDVK